MNASTPVAGRILPDTNAFIALLNGDPTVIEALRSASELILSAIVLGELTYGALNSGRPEENLAKLETLRQRCVFALVDDAVVHEYGRVRLELKRKGRPIPENDVWIAAAVFAVKATLLTDDAHFAEVDGINMQGMKAR